MAVTDEAITRIKAMIISGKLKPGDRLPPEKELSEALGLSRGSLREAVKALEVMRVLDVRRGDGTYVTSLDPGVLLEAMSFVVDLHDDASILEIFAVRRILEPAAAALAAGRIDASALASLRHGLESVTAATPLDELVAHDLAFHSAISAAAGNRYLSHLLDSLSGQTVRARIWRGVTQGGAVEQTLTEHASILAALESGDSELVHALCLVHISGIEGWLHSAL